MHQGDLRPLRSGIHRRNEMVIYGHLNDFIISYMTP